MDNSELILGRPFGRCGILYRKSLAPYRIKCNSKRFCARYFSLCSPGNPHLNTLLINVYLPTDYGTNDSNNAYLESLCEFISTHPFDNLIICRDFNVDFSRNSHNCRHLNLFMQNLNLVCPDLSSNIKYTFRRDDLASFSWPDHVLTLGHHQHLIKGVPSIDDVDNFSDHLLASSPGLRGEGKGRPGTHCMRMRHYSPDFGESGYVWILSVYLHRKLHVFKVMMSVSHIDATRTQPACPHGKRWV